MEISYSYRVVERRVNGSCTFTAEAKQNDNSGTGWYAQSQVWTPIVLPTSTMEDALKDIEKHKQFTLEYNSKNYTKIHWL